MGNEAPSAVGYVRVSTDEQAEGGVSLEAQAAKVRAYCALYGLRLICVLSDGGESGKSLDRPALTEALEMLAVGKADGLVVAKLDRLTRSVKDLGTLVDRYFSETGGRQLWSVSDAIDTRTAGGRLVLNVLTSVSQWERETIVERTRSAMDHKRSKGERLGQVPYGYAVGADGKTLLTVPEERDTVYLMQRWRSQGSSLQEIAERLNFWGRPAKRGGEWCPSAVASVLRRAARAQA